ncbi:hypothetical protein [Aliiroseovarius sp.]|uniref:hypothetical protein n=1 Tax=Aliiroseovarius sp. TaxID=1872442 RepID=UPI00262F1B15|nr:hypothetical protein [Aliiroseovarius sp.]
MDLVLHIGAHRTATTAMQDMLVAARPALSAARVTALVHEELGAVEGFSTVPVREGWDKTRAAFDRATRGAETVLISEENLIGDMGWNIRSGQFYPNARRRLSAYRDFLGQAPLRIGLGIRGYADYWISAHAQELSYCHVGREGVVRFAEARAQLMAVNRGWRDLVRDLRVVFPESELVIWPLEHRIALPDLARRLLGLADLALPNPPAGVNAAPDHGKLKPLEAFRAKNPNASRHAVQEFLDRCDKQPFEGFSCADQLRLQARYADDLGALGQGADGAVLLPPNREAA